MIQAKARARQHYGGASTVLASTSKTSPNTATGKASTDIHAAAVQNEATSDVASYSGRFEDLFPKPARDD